VYHLWSVLYSFQAIDVVHRHFLGKPQTQTKGGSVRRSLNLLVPLPFSLFLPTNQKKNNPNRSLDLLCLTTCYSQPCCLLPVLPSLPSSVLFLCLLFGWKSQAEGRTFSSYCRQRPRENRGELVPVQPWVPGCVSAGTFGHFPTLVLSFVPVGHAGQGGQLVNCGPTKRVLRR
jgi:hypothetical protein